MWVALLVSGTVASIVLCLFARQVSMLSFGTPDHTASVLVISLSIFFGCVLAGFRAMAQGLRRIADLAMINVLGSVGATVAVIAIALSLHDRAIAALVTIPALASAAAAWIVIRMRKTYPDSRPRDASWTVASSLIRLGSIFMFSAVAIGAIAYFTRALVMQTAGAAAAGHYQSASALAALYTGFIIQAMSADYFPRLSAAAVAQDALRAVNEQIEVGVLVALPGVIGTIALAPFIISIFYSSEFAPATEVLRWMVIGSLLQLVSWPVGLLLPARDDRRLFLVTEVIGVTTHFLLVWSCVTMWGLRGAGAAFLLYNLVYAVFILCVAFFRAEFALSTRNWMLVGFSTLAIGIAVGSTLALPAVASVPLNVLLALSVLVYALWALQRAAEFGNTHLGSRLARLRQRLTRGN
jgi:PST family polysaccharide transporter